MTLWFLIIIAIIVMIGITLMFILSTKKAYSIEHKIDPLPKNPTEHKDSQ